MADDYLKIFKQRSMGVRGQRQAARPGRVALAFAGAAPAVPRTRRAHPASHAISFFRDTGWSCPTALFVIWIWSSSRRRRTRSTSPTGSTGWPPVAPRAVRRVHPASVLAVRPRLLFGQPRCYDVRDPLDLAVFAAACTGACLGFLWWNTAPARIFMGDTGSLALGGAIAALAILSRTELLLPLLGGLFVIVTLSVIGQVGSYKLTGRRMFRMAPLHHHFEMKGWPRDPDRRAVLDHPGHVRRGGARPVLRGVGHGG